MFRCIEAGTDKTILKSFSSTLVKKKIAFYSLMTSSSLISKKVTHIMYLH